MPDQNINSLDANHTTFSRIEDLALQLQEVLNRLKMNADHLAGELFHHDALFSGSDCTRLDDKLAEIISELKALTSLEIDE